MKKIAFLSVLVFMLSLGLSSEIRAEDKETITLDETMEELAEDFANLSKDLSRGIDGAHVDKCVMGSIMKDVRIGMSAVDAEKVVRAHLSDNGGIAVGDTQIAAFWKGVHNGKETLYLHVSLTNGKVSGLQFKKADTSGKIVNHSPCKH